MEKKNYILILLCTFIMSCNRAKNTNASMPETINEYIVHLENCEKTDFYTSNVYNFTKDGKKQNISLEILKHEDGQFNIFINYRDPSLQNKSYIPSFKEQIKLYRSFIEKHLDEEAVKNIKSITIPLLFAGDINGEISAKYQYFREHVPLDSIVFKSKMKEKIDSVFSPYGLHVGRVYIEKFCLTNKSIIKKYDIHVLDYASMPQNLVDGYACFTFEKRN